MLFFFLSPSNFHLYFHVYHILQPIPIMLSLSAALCTLFTFLPIPSLWLSLVPLSLPLPCDLAKAISYLLHLCLPSTVTFSFCGLALLSLSDPSAHFDIRSQAPDGSRLCLRLCIPTATVSFSMTPLTLSICFMSPFKVT